MATVRISRFEAAERLLPPVCMRCGAEATVLKRKAFSWHPSWVLVLLLAGLLPFLILALVLTKYMTIHAPLCEEHRNHWTWRSLFTWLGLTFFLILGIMAIIFSVQERGPGAAAVGGLLCLGTLIGGLGWLIAAAIIQLVGIRPTEITNRGMTLTNVSPAFADALEDERDMREEEDAYDRRPRRRDWDEEREEEGPWQR
jgi:hypothetical protein